MDLKKMDLENLDELIGLCEDKMVSPFRKKKPEMDELPEAPEEGESEEKPDLSEMDMDDLIEAYEKSKMKQED